MDISGAIRYIPRNNFSVVEKIGRQIIRLNYKQFPVDLAWGITVHRSQGKTFGEKYGIDCHVIADPTMFYVAMSRATRLENIELFHFSKMRLTIKDGEEGFQTLFHTKVSPYGWKFEERRILLVNASKIANLTKYEAAFNNFERLILIHTSQRISREMLSVPLILSPRCPIFISCREKGMTKGQIKWERQRYFIRMNALTIVLQPTSCASPEDAENWILFRYTILIPQKSNVVLHKDTLENEDPDGFVLSKMQLFFL